MTIQTNLAVSAALSGSSVQNNLAFNTNAEYKFFEGSYFLHGNRGLIDSVHRGDPTVFNYYKQLKSQDWDENEFPLRDAMQDFILYPAEGMMMKNNIGWQWGGDSNAANSLIPMVAPFAPVTDAWLWFVKQGENENLHALSYSEVVRISVPDGMNEILRIHQDNDTLRRVNFIAEVFDKIIRVGSRINLGEVSMDSDEASDALMLMLCAVFILERGQFMPSFANTAMIYFQSKFVAPCETIRKIAADEWNTHIPMVRHILRNELKVPQRIASMNRIRPIVEKLLIEVIGNEVNWNERQFLIGGDQLGFTVNMGADYAYYAGTDISTELKLETNLKTVTKNPLPIMDSFFNLNRERKASMELKGGNYTTVNPERDDGVTPFDTFKTEEGSEIKFDL